MITVILVIHLLIAIAMVGIILMQRSEGGALGMGGGGSGFMTGRAAGNLLTRVTTLLGASFMVTSLVLALLATPSAGPRKSIFEQPAAGTDQPATATPAPGPTSPAPPVAAPAPAPAADAVTPPVPPVSPPAPAAPAKN
ncbi:MAG: preprotein translocase subunit SecG [Alphaproteobacteria bacterium]